MDTSKIKEISKGVAEIRNGRNIVWARYDDTSGAPGPKKLLGGNLQAGFFGEVSASNLITGDSLASMIGLSGGNSQYSNGGWLKFAYMGKVELIAKKPFRYGIPWDNINSANAVFGYRTVQIKGETYKVRLMKGKTEGKQYDRSSYSGDINKGSEWNKLMLPIHKNAPSNWGYPTNVESPTEDWGVNYSDNDLLTNNDNGSLSWCQEYGASSDRRLGRGHSEISNADYGNPAYLMTHYGWRPVLELVR